MAPEPSFTESNGFLFDAMTSDLDVPWCQYSTRPQYFLPGDDPSCRDIFIPPLSFQLPSFSTSEALPIFSLDSDWGVPQIAFLSPQTSHETPIFHPRSTEISRNTVRNRAFCFVEFMVLRVFGCIAYHGPL